MTRGEAAAILGVDEHAPAGEIRKRYESLHTDYQIRLTNAPTPTLKKTYQQKLQDVLDACAVLVPGFSPAQHGGDLPSAEPVLTELLDRRTSPPVARPLPKPVVADAAARGGFPRSTMVVGVIAVVLASALSLAGLRWYRASARVAQMEADRAELLETAVGLEALVKAQENLFYKDRLSVRNLSKNPVKIVAVALIYRDASGALKVAHSGNYDYPTWELRPNGVVQLDAQMARGRLWDGPVLYYSFLIDYAANEPFLKAGIWAEDIDRLDKVVTLDLD